MSPISYLTTQYRKAAVWFVTRRDNRIWTERLAAALAKLPEAEHKWMKPTLQTHISYARMTIAQAAPAYHQTTKQSLERFEQTKLDIVVHVLRQLIPLTEIIGVQPMSGPVGQVMRLAYNEQSDGSNRLEILKDNVSAGTRKLHARFNMEVAQTSHIPTDMADYLPELIGEEIAHEIVAEVLADLESIAKHHETVDGTMTHPSVDTTDVAMVTANKLANMIAVSTKRGPGNFIVVSPMMLSIIQSSPTVEFVRHVGAQFSALSRVGTINGNVRVYLSHWMESSVNQEQILVGYNGSGSIDTGYVYSPYVMLMCSGVVMDPMTFMPQISFMTRYGKSITQASGGYYGVLTFDNPLGIVDLPSEPVEDDSVASNSAS